MKEIIVKREDDVDLSLEIIEDKFLRVNLSECGVENQFMDFALEEIEELQQSISIMKDRLESKLSNTKDKPNNVTPTEQKVAENIDLWRKYNEIRKQVALGEKIEYKIGDFWYTFPEIVGDLKSQPLLDCRIRKNK